MRPDNERRMACKEDLDIRPGLERSARNTWAESIEEVVRDMCPYPTSYDVTCTQPARFSEYTYTELCGGLYTKTQSVEINTRIIREAAKIPATTDRVGELLGLLQDKYELDSIGDSPKKVVFVPGHNMYHLLSKEIMSRLAHEQDDVFVKLHPITDTNMGIPFKSAFGAHRLIGRDFSGTALLKNCTDVYTTSTSELCLYAVALGKKLHNVGDFFQEWVGCYYAITSVLFTAENPREALNNILDCEFSGILLPSMVDYETRLQRFYDVSLQMKEVFGEVTSKNLQPCGKKDR